MTTLQLPNPETDQRNDYSMNNYIQFFFENMLKTTSMGIPLI